MLLIIGLNKEVGELVPTAAKPGNCIQRLPLTGFKTRPGHTNLHRRHTALHGRQLNSVLPTLAANSLYITMVVKTVDHWIKIYRRKRGLDYPNTVTHEMIPTDHSNVIFYSMSWEITANLLPRPLHAIKYMWGNKNNITHNSVVFVCFFAGSQPWI